MSRGDKITLAVAVPVISLWTVWLGLCLGVLPL